MEAQPVYLAEEAGGGEVEKNALAPESAGVVGTP